MDEPMREQQGGPGGVGVGVDAAAAPVERRDEPAAHPNGPNGAGNHNTPLERARHLLGVDGPSFARRLREARQDKHWTRLELASRAGVAPSTVSNLEREKSDNPDPVVALALAIALGYDNVADLLGEQPGTPRLDDGPGPMTLEKLVESLLRGVWAAQGSRPVEVSAGAGSGKTEQYLAGAVARSAEAAEAVAEGGTAAASHLQRAAGPGAVALSVGVVVLVEPRTVG